MLQFTTAVPYWVSFAFILVFPIFFFMIAHVIKEGVDSSRNKNGYVYFYSTILFFTFFLIYTSVSSSIGLFKGNVLPPKILVYTTIPLLLFYFLVVFRSKLYWDVLKRVSLKSLVKIHIFRFVGLFFIVSFLYDALPKSFALIAGFGDVTVALIAVFITRFIESKNYNWNKIVLIWNILGFWDIISVLISAIYTTKHSIEYSTQNLEKIAEFPFCWIPAVAPATIIFLHISIFKKLKMIKSES